jgi:hypothetical protein
MKYILTPNPNPPYNLRRNSLPFGSRNLQFPTEAAMIEHVVARLKETGRIQDGVYWVVEESELPGGEVSKANDYFFDAWEWTGTCQVNMPKARDIHMGHIRTARNTELAKLDTPFMRALEDGDVAEQDRIKAIKTRLREIPQTINLEGASTPEALKATWSDDLP